MPRPHTIFETDRRWENYHGNVSFTPDRYYDIWNIWDDNSSPSVQRWQPGVAALKQIIREAERENAQVRALGAGWSLSNATETAGYLLNTKPLNIIEVGVRSENCAPEFLKRNDVGKPADPARLVFAQCGAQIAELNKELENRGLALPTSGANSGQTICGAMSTGTHGAAFKFGSVQDFVHGLHLITEGGREYWIEPKSVPVVNEKFCKVLGPDVKLVRDDDLFNAVRVSFGSFGIIHAVLLQAHPIYLLERHVVKRPYEQVRAVLTDLTKLDQLDLKDRDGKAHDADLYHFEIVLNPYAVKKEREGLRGEVFVRYMYKMAADADWIGYKPGDSVVTDESFAIVGKMADLTWPLIPVPFRFIMDRHMGLGQVTRLTPGAIFGSTAIPGQSVSTEMGFALEDVIAALEIILQECHAFPFLGIITLRYVKGSPALLAVTPYAPITCMIEIPSVNTSHTRKALQRIWSALEKSDIKFTYHWGQCQPTNLPPENRLERLRLVYGDRVERWLKARGSFLSAAGRLFSNPLLEQSGLAVGSSGK